MCHGRDFTNTFRYEVEVEWFRPAGPGRSGVVTVLLIALSRVVRLENGKECLK